jgi:hypothetical protein
MAPGSQDGAGDAEGDWGRAGAWARLNAGLARALLPEHQLADERVAVGGLQNRPGGLPKPAFDRDNSVQWEGGDTEWRPGLDALVSKLFSFLCARSLSCH